MVRAMRLSVDCQAGHRGESTPCRFRFGERAVEVAEVIDRWLAPERRYFKVRGGDGALYILLHDVPAACWELTMFDRRPNVPRPLRCSNDVAT